MSKVQSPCLFLKPFGKNHGRLPQGWHCRFPTKPWTHGGVTIPGVGGGFLRSMQGKTAGRQLMIQNDRDGYPDVAGMCTNCDLKYRGKSGHCNECEHLSQDERSSCLCLYRKSQAKMNC